MEGIDSNSGLRNASSGSGGTRVALIIGVPVGMHSFSKEQREAVRQLLHTVLMRDMGTFGPDMPARNFPTFLQPLLSFIGLALVIKAVAGIAAGVGIIQRADWARMLAIVVACVSLLSMPFGTAIGIYTLWVLFSPNADAEFRAQHIG
jgi:hypothetical protein